MPISPPIVIIAVLAAATRIITRERDGDDSCPESISAILKAHGARTRVFSQAPGQGFSSSLADRGPRIEFWLRKTLIKVQKKRLVMDTCWRFELVDGSLTRNGK